MLDKILGGIFGPLAGALVGLSLPILITYSIIKRSLLHLGWQGVPMAGIILPLNIMSGLAFGAALSLVFTFPLILTGFLLGASGGLSLVLRTLKQCLVELLDLNRDRQAVLPPRGNSISESNQMVLDRISQLPANPHRAVKLLSEAEVERYKLYLATIEDEGQRQSETQKLTTYLNEMDQPCPISLNARAEMVQPLTVKGNFPIEGALPRVFSRVYELSALKAYITTCGNRREAVEPIGRDKLNDPDNIDFHLGFAGHIYLFVALVRAKLEAWRGPSVKPDVRAEGEPFVRRANSPSLFNPLPEPEGGEDLRAEGAPYEDLRAEGEPYKERPLSYRGRF